MAAEGFCRAAFLLDRRDTPLLAALEAVARCHNAVVLGLARPAAAEAGAAAVALTTTTSSSSSQHDGARLEAALAQYRGVAARGGALLQALATTRRLAEGGEGAVGDAVTGFQLIAGGERLVVLEAAKGAQSLPPHLQQQQQERQQPEQPEPAPWLPAAAVVRALASWALEEQRTAQQAPQSGAPWLARRVVFDAEGSPNRLYSELGAALPALKLRASLERLAAEPASCPQGALRPDCAAGLRRLLALARAPWGRQAGALALWPAAAELRAVDARFGGELSSGDLLGVEAEAVACGGDDGGGGADGGGSGGGDSGGLPGSARRAARRQRRPRRKAPLDAHNEAFATSRSEAARARAARDVGLEHRREVAALARSEASEAIRARWAAWNPQRAAAKELQRRVAAGELTLEVRPLLGG